MIRIHISTFSYYYIDETRGRVVPHRRSPSAARDVRRFARNRPNTAWERSGQSNPTHRSRAGWRGFEDRGQGEEPEIPPIQPMNGQIGPIHSGEKRPLIGQTTAASPRLYRYLCISRDVFLEKYLLDLTNRGDRFAGPADLEGSGAVRPRFLTSLSRRELPDHGAKLSLDGRADRPISATYRWAGPANGESVCVLVTSTAMPVSSSTERVTSSTLQAYVLTWLPDRRMRVRSSRRSASTSMSTLR